MYNVRLVRIIHFFQDLINRSRNLLPRHDLALLELALSSGRHGARVASHYTMRKGDLGDDPCECTILFADGSTTCSLDSLEHPIPLGNPLVLDTDHRISNDDSVPTVVLYADMGRALAGSFHSKLASMANQGIITYILRHAGHSTALLQPRGDHRLQGYSAELAVKSKEYKLFDDGPASTVIDEPFEGEEVGGLLFHQLITRRPDLEAELKQLRLDTIGNVTEPLKAWKLSGVSLQATQRVLTSADPLSTLEDLSSNFVARAPGLIRTRVDPILKQEAEANALICSKSRIDDANFLLVNGRMLQTEDLTIHTLYDALRSEMNAIEPLIDRGVSPALARELLNSQQFARPTGHEWRFEIPDSVLFWLNNLEDKDERSDYYNGWPKTLNTLLQRMNPYQLWAPIARNLVNLQLIIDPDSRHDLFLLAAAARAVQDAVPARFSVTLLNSRSRENPSPALRMLRGMKKAFDEEDRDGVLEFLESAKVPRDSKPTTDKEADAMKVAQSTNMPHPAILVNGRLRDENKFHSVEKSLERIKQLVSEEQYRLRWSIHTGQLRDRTPDLLQAILHTGVGTVFSRHHPAIHPCGCHPDQRTIRQISLLGDMLAKAQWARASQMTVQGSPLSIVVVGRPGTPTFSDMKYAALTRLATKGNSHGVRVGFLSCGQAPASIELVEGTRWEDGSSSLLSPGNARICSEILQDSPSAIVINGRVITTVGARPFEVEDILELENGERSSATVIAAALKQILSSPSIPTNEALQVQGSDAYSEERRKGDLVMEVASWLGLHHSRSAEKRPGFGWRQAERQSSVLPSNLQLAVKFGANDEASAPLVVHALVNPLAPSTHRIAAALKVLENKAFGAAVSLHLHPTIRVSDMPLKAMYRSVGLASVAFDSDGLLDTRNAVALFNGAPSHLLLTANLRHPEAWLVRADDAVFDMDNIRLDSLGSDEAVLARYRLRNIVVEGSAMQYGTPQQGMELSLVPQSEPRTALHDTVVMENHGYFQLHASPGLFRIQIPGDASSILSLQGGDGSIISGDDEDDASVAVLVADLLGATVDLQLRPRPTPGPVRHPTTYDKENEECIHVFSLASGHMYERLLGIMMMSVTNQTSKPVKFWLIEPFLSPDFLDVLPTLAQEIGFKYGLVTYKWPSWVRFQTEKQRLIWAYKILYLDVLFPLTVRKIIFVDADQVVRADLNELWTHDLGRATIAMTPMGNSRAETEGFRFWKQGYWVNHLQGLPYHISALFIANLDGFRRMHHGDRLRGAYQGLTADPNSLANLDQDLPNYLQHQVPIHSLPQEWLWCETWCDTPSLAKAKTIDLCNNPLTKEPKLDQARRILPEWEGLDEAVQKLMARARVK